jgi:hypothetical protein
VQFVQLLPLAAVEAHGWTRLKRTGTRASGNTKTLSPKAVEIVRLVDALSADRGSHDGVMVGRGIADLLRVAYAARGRSVPRWVEELRVYYAREKRAP